MNVINVDRKVQSHTDQIELVISILCFLNNIRLSKTHQKVLAYFVVYGLKEKTDDLLINSKIVPHVESLRNVKTKLHKLGFLKRFPGVYNSYELNLNSAFEPNNIIELRVKIDRS
jgi:hypothetical protein